MRGNIQEHQGLYLRVRTRSTTAVAARSGLRQRVVLVVLALIALQLGSLIRPAYACGCGAMVPDRGTRMAVDRETSVVGWDGRTERILMRFTVDGDAPKAAWIMPVPGRATVRLGDGALFDELETATAPEHRKRYHFWPRDGDWPFSVGSSGDAAGAPAPGAGAPGVGVVGRERLGAFDVARLTATDPHALRSWLETNGFELPSGLEAELRPYVGQKWEYVAVRLAPDAEGAVLRGTLDPLELRFASDRLIYPMRLSRLAKTPQALGLYVLAAHRMEPQSRIGGDRPVVTFAGKVDPSAQLDAFTGGDERFLTALEQAFPQPERIDADHVLRRTPQDTPYRRVVYENALLTVGGVPAWLLTFGGGLALVPGAVLWRVRRYRRRPVIPPPPVHAPPPMS